MSVWATGLKVHDIEKRLLQTFLVIFTLRLHVMQHTVLLSQFCLSICQMPVL